MKIRAHSEAQGAEHKNSEQIILANILYIVILIADM